VTTIQSLNSHDSWALDAPARSPNLALRLRRARSSPPSLVDQRRQSSPKEAKRTSREK
jgi:hypothetical protein